MSLAIFFTLFTSDFNLEFGKFFPTFAIGGGIGLYLAKKVEMIQMP